MPPTIAAIVLAAGGSSRLGEPKQLLRHHGVPLVRRAADCALAAGCAPVFVVLGAHEMECRAALGDASVTVVGNAGWERGIGTSLRAGALAAAAANVDAACVLVCDQPNLTAAALTNLIESWKRSGAPVAASRFFGSVGSPALFSREMFAALQSLPDGAGAKRVIEACGERVAIVEFEAGAIDVDTPGDLDHLR